MGLVSHMTRLSLTSVVPVPMSKSKAAQLAELLPEIEAALVAGHSHRAIFEDVKKTVGLDLTFGYYENTIHRLRRRNKTDLQVNLMPTPTPTLQTATQKIFITPPAEVVQTVGPPKSKLQKILSEPIGDFFS